MSPRWSLAAIALVLGACTLTASLDDLKENAESDGGPDGASGGAGGAGASGSTGGTGASGGSGGTNAGGAGGSGGGSDADADVVPDPCTDAADCQACCQSSHGQGAKDFVAAIQACVCQSTSACFTVCSQFCSNGPIEADCSTCVSTAAVQSCLATQCTSADCKAYLACAGIL